LLYWGQLCVNFRGTNRKIERIQNDLPGRCSTFSFTTSRPENVSFLRSGLNQIARTQSDGAVSAIFPCAGEIEWRFAREENHSGNKITEQETHPRTIGHCINPKAGIGQANVTA